MLYFVSVFGVSIYFCEHVSVFNIILSLYTCTFFPDAYFYSYCVTSIYYVRLIVLCSIIVFHMTLCMDRPDCACAELDRLEQCLSMDLDYVYIP